MLMLSNLVLHVFFPRLNLMLMFHFTFMHSLLCMHVCVCALSTCICILFLDCISFFITCLFNSIFFSFRFGYNNYYNDDDFEKRRRKKTWFGFHWRFLPFTLSWFFSLSVALGWSGYSHIVDSQFRYSYNQQSDKTRKKSSFNSCMVACLCVSIFKFLG